MHFHNVTILLSHSSFFSPSNPLSQITKQNQNPHLINGQNSGRNLNMEIQNQKHFSIPPKALKIFILVAAASAIAYHPVNGLESRKLDDEAPGDQGIKCNPSCVQSPPPPSPSPPLPSPPPPCPPPPALPPPTPPAPPKIPPSQYCPPPPSSYIYFTGPPGNLYPIDNGYNNGAGKRIPSSFPLLVASGILGLLALW